MGNKEFTTQELKEILDRGSDTIQENFLDQESPSSDPVESVDVITDEMVQEELDDIKGMGFVELVSEKKALEQRMRLLEETKEAMVTLIDIKKSTEEDETLDDIAKKIQVTDAEANAEKYGITDMDQFLAEYDDSKEKLQKTIDYCEERLHEFDDVKRTATFMNQSMLELIEKREKDLDKYNLSESIEKNMRKFYSTVRSIFENRDNVDWILEKIDSKRIMLRRYVQDLKKDHRKGRRDAVAAAQKNASKAFGKTFSMDQMTQFDKYLQKIFNPGNDEKDMSVFMTQYALYLIYSDQKIWKKGTQKWVEVLIMNVLNILEDTYDLPNGVEYFNDQLLKIKECVMKDLPSVW